MFNWIVKLVKNAIKRKLIWNFEGIAFDGEGLWSFGNDFAKIAVIFAVDNSSSSNKQKLFLLSNGPTDTIKCNFIVLSQVNKISLTVNELH